MIEMQSNPDVEALKLTLWIAGSIIGIMLMVIAFFLRKQIEASETLTKAVSDLTNAVTVLENREQVESPVTRTRLNEHAKRINEHSERITIVETRLNIKR